MESHWARQLSPTLSLLSRIRQERPPRCRWYAVARPAWPAPMIAVSSCSIVMKTSGGRKGAVGPGCAAGVTEMPDEHKTRGDDVEGMKGPDGAGRQLQDVDAVHRVAHIGQHEVSAAVGGEHLRARGLDQHGQGAHREQHGRDRSRYHRHTRHVEDATEDTTRHASGW